MIVDTSAIIAILNEETGFEGLLGALNGASGAKIAAGTLVETMTVATARKGAAGPPVIWALLRAQNVEVVPTTQDDARIAAAAYLRYGKGMGARGATAGARLNLGDCFAYALAKRTGEALLCVGDDFARTDLALVPLEAS